MPVLAPLIKLDEELRSNSSAHHPRSARAARSESVPIVELSLGVVVVPGDAGVPLMLPLLGAVLSVVLGDVIVLGVVGFGDVVFGVCAPGPGVALGLVLESVPLVCAYARPAATANATPALAAMVLNLVMIAPVLDG